MWIVEELYLWSRVKAELSESRSLEEGRGRQYPVLREGAARWAVGSLAELDGAGTPLREGCDVNSSKGGLSRLPEKKVDN